MFEKESKTFKYKPTPKVQEPVAPPIDVGAELDQIVGLIDKGKAALTNMIGASSVEPATLLSRAIIACADLRDRLEKRKS